MDRPDVDKEPLRFRGSPVAMECFAPLTRQEAHGAMIALKLGRRAHPVMAPLRWYGVAATHGAARLRFVLPASTAPGTYTGSARIKDAEYPVVADVEARHYLVATPSRLSLEAAPGAEVAVEITLFNGGNVACHIDRAYAFGLFDVHGLERGIGAAFLAESGKGRDRIDRIAEGFAESHGGLVRVTAREGAGPLEPGEHRTLKLAFRFSDRLKEGRAYYGTLPLHNLRYYVQVRASGPARK